MIPLFFGSLKPTCEFLCSRMIISLTIITYKRKRIPNGALGLVMGAVPRPTPLADVGGDMARCGLELAVPLGAVLLEVARGRGSVGPAAGLGPPASLPAAQGAGGLPAGFAFPGLAGVAMSHRGDTSTTSVV